MKRLQTAAILLLLLWAADAIAAIKLPGLVGDNMILQRAIKIPVWGWAEPGEHVLVKFKGKTYKAIASAPDGKWMVKLDQTDAGGPYEMAIKGQTDDIRIKNILVGDVWLCSGQSNMAFDFNNSRAKALYANDIAISANDHIRQVLVSRGYASAPAANCKTTGWRMASPQTLNSFSAVAYFYARNLYEQYHVPIGLINSSLGGTIAEAWTSEKGLKELPQYTNDILFLHDTIALDKKVKDYQTKVINWGKKIEETDNGNDANGNPAWAMPMVDDSQWATMPQPGFWDKNGYGTFFGSVWFRKEIEVPQAATGKDAVVILGQIDDADITYFNGQMIGKTSNRDYKREYKIPAALIKPGKNILAIRIINYSGTGGIFPADSLRFKSGETTVSLSGPWKFNQGIKMEARPGALDPKNLPTSLYNAMIAPLEPYAIKGVLWYQGEYNAHQAYAYRPLFQALINDWRAKWQQGDIPFVFVQLPNFQPVYDHPVESEWAELREAQSMALIQPNTAMAVAIDIGEAEDIHPVDKKDVGYRLSLASRRLVYGEKSLVASGPVYQSMRVDKDKIILSFETGGNDMISKNGDELKSFAIAGDDKKFVWAKAIIKHSTIEVSSPAVVHPVAVRYAWAGNPAGCNLFNKAGLPASPFRTDTWPGITITN
ncbi:sialate O-acetylesterase [Mucilaginibacter sp.]|jgi:sialate O-acetylesterase|uniref:sialate O-acetylesterase n=1 Tax=Mucilaginibacter sp. TaxID=1882438 RepID=UPI00356749FC